MQGEDYAALRDEIKAMRECLIRMDERLAQRLDKQEDHERRLRLLEKWRYALPASVGVALVSACASIVVLLVR